MGDIAVRVENLGKCYQIGQAKSGNFRQSFGSWIDGLRGRNNNGQVAESKEFWALKDINFEIKKGEAVGIIGRNGAGKSTLLKILSRITEPTKGRFEIKGRVSSLLEVGTGFHPELSGRENIYLNGTILGMKRKEIKAKFDEIVAFSGVEKFIDTPVKHYSSGMKVRLAFSVAAHLEPEILIIDEVLAVGDAEFQKKCLGKMEDVTGEGRTVLFVSHNLDAVERLCKTGILLDQGKVSVAGTVHQVLKNYFSKIDSSVLLRSRSDRKGTGEIKIVEIKMKNIIGNEISFVRSGESFKIIFSYESDQNKDLGKRNDILVGFGISTNTGIPVTLHHNRISQDIFNGISTTGEIHCSIYGIPLNEGIYYLSYSIMDRMGRGGYIDYLENAIKVEVVAGDFYPSAEVPPSTHSICLINATWNIQNSELKI